jgi:phosphatidylethanolamine-binding protein (PEBP) family uncharacterized protein
VGVVVERFVHLIIWDISVNKNMTKKKGIMKKRKKKEGLHID